MDTRPAVGSTLRDRDGRPALVLGYSTRFVLLLVPGGADRYAPLARYDVAALPLANLSGFVVVVGESFRPVGQDRTHALRRVKVEANARYEAARHEADCGRRALAAEYEEIGRALWNVARRCEAAGAARAAA